MQRFLAFFLVWSGFAFGFPIPRVHAQSCDLGLGFPQAPNFGVGDTPFSLVAADLNRDGRLDLATANAGSNDVSVLLGNGDGMFQAERRFAVGFFPLSLVAADLNGDGRLDLATGNTDVTEWWQYFPSKAMGMAFSDRFLEGAQGLKLSGPSIRPTRPPRGGNGRLERADSPPPANEGTSS